MRNTSAVSLHKHEAIRKREVNQRADGYSNQVGYEGVESRLAYENKHQYEIARKRHRSACQVEAQQHQRNARLRTIFPCPSPVPDEVVQHACFYGKSRRGQVMQPGHTQQQRKHNDLHEYAARAHCAELDPAMKDCSPVRQLIPSEFEISNFNLGSEITRLETSPQKVLRRNVGVERRQQHYD